MFKLNLKKTKRCTQNTTNKEFQYNGTSKMFQVTLKEAGKEKTMFSTAGGKKQQNIHQQANSFINCGASIPWKTLSGEKEEIINTQNFTGSQKHCDQRWGEGTCHKGQVLFDFFYVIALK